MDWCLWILSVLLMIFQLNTLVFYGFFPSSVVISKRDDTYLSVLGCAVRDKLIRFLSPVV